jgi:predicted solute-binding protein
MATMKNGSEVRMAKASVLEQTEVQVNDLPDEEVLALSESKMSLDLHEELSELLALQRESEIDDAGRERLDEIMEEYDRNLLLKSEALRVAVERGLRPPLG